MADPKPQPPPKPKPLVQQPVLPPVKPYTNPPKPKPGG